MSGLEPPDEDSLRLAEALVFAAAAPVAARALAQLLPETADADAVLAALRRALCRARRGAGARSPAAVQFRTAPDLAPRLRKVVQLPRRLPRVAMETLAIVAYHQPVTRAEIEEIRGASLSQQTLDALLEAGLIAPRGRRESPGPPDAVGHHAGIPGAVRPGRPARPAAARGPAGRAAWRSGLLQSADGDRRKPCRRMPSRPDAARRDAGYLTQLPKPDRACSISPGPRSP